MPHSPADSSLPSLDTLYNRLLEKARQPPYSGSRPLFVAGRPCGWVTAEVCDVLAQGRYIQVGPEAVRIGEGSRPGFALNALLAETAIALREAGCLRGWRDELLAVSAGDATIGAIERAAVRPLGLLTQAVHLNAWTPDGQLWIARRSLAKSTDPGMWDTLVGGLVGADEDPREALMRECGEEAGLEPNHLTERSPMRHVLRIQRQLPEGYQVEDVLASTCVLEAGTQPVNRDGEVMEIATAPVKEVLARIACEQFTLEAALVVLNDLKQRKNIQKV